MVRVFFSSSSGWGSLYFLPKNVATNANRCIEVLDMFRIYSSSVFVHDSASCYKARKVTKWLTQRNINVLEWPGNNPDLNPIENCWHIMKNKVCVTNPSSLQKLQEEIRKIWSLEMSPVDFKKLSDRMPERLNIVVKSKGNMTKY